MIYLWIAILNFNWMNNKAKQFCGFFFFLFFLGAHLWHMEVPRLGVELELQLLAYATSTTTWDLGHFCYLHQSSWQGWIPNPLGKARDQTHLLMNTSWSVSTVSQQELPFLYLIILLYTSWNTVKISYWLISYCNNFKYEIAFLFILYLTSR